MAERVTRGERELEHIAQRDPATNLESKGGALGGAETSPEKIDLADVLRGVAARLDAVLDERRREPADEDAFEPGAEAVRDAASARASSAARSSSRPSAQTDHDVRRAAVSTLIVRIGADGTVLGPPRASGPDRSGTSVELPSDPTGDGTPRPEAATRSTISVPAPEPERAETFISKKPALRSDEPTAIHARPEAGPTTVAPLAPAHADVNIDELRSRLEKRRRAVQEAESASATAAPQVRATLIVVRNVMVGVALGVAIAVGRTLLS